MYLKNRTTITEGNENNLVAEEEVSWANDKVCGQTVTIKGRRYTIRVISPQGGDVKVIVDKAP